MSFFGSYFGEGSGSSSSGSGSGSSTPSAPVESPIDATHPDYVAHTTDAISRLPQMFRGVPNE